MDTNKRKSTERSRRYRLRQAYRRHQEALQSMQTVDEVEGQDDDDCCMGSPEARGYDGSMVNADDAEEDDVEAQGGGHGGSMVDTDNAEEDDVEAQGGGYGGSMVDTDNAEEDDVEAQGGGYGSSMVNADDDVTSSDEEDIEIPNATRGRPLKQFFLHEKIYDGSRLTQLESAALVSTFISEAGLKKESIQPLLNLIEIHCPSANSCISSPYFLSQFTQTDDFITFHKFCQSCNSYLGPKDEVMSNSVCPSCSSSVKLDERNLDHTFVEFDLEKQLKNLLSSNELHTCVDSHSYTHDHISDFRSAFRYRNFRLHHSDKHLSYTLAMDSLPLFKTSKYQILPIYLRVNELPSYARNNDVICAGLWYGINKAVTKTLLTPIIQSLNRLRCKGFQWNDTIFFLHPLLGCFDAVQKADIQRIHQYNGSYGCGLCYHPGRRVRKGHGWVNAYFYQDPPFNARSLSDTKEIGQFVECSDEKHVNGVCGLSALAFLDGFDFIGDAPPDPLHQVCLGVVRHLFALWFDRENHASDWYIGDKISEIDSRVSQFRIPKCINRLPRSLNERRHFRGHEFEAWLLYYGPVAFKGIMARKYYHHFRLLSVSIYTLSKSNIWSHDLESASNTLRLFGSLQEKIYGIENMTYNVHQVSEHLASSVKQFGPLHDFSTAPFESHHYKLKRSISNAHRIHIQIAHHLQEHGELRKLQHKVKPSLINIVTSHASPNIILNGCELYGPGKACSTQDEGRYLSFKRLRTANGIFCHTKDYFHENMKRDSSKIIAFQGSSTNTNFHLSAFLVKKIFVFTRCRCDRSLCEEHAEVRVHANEISLSRNPRMPSSYFHIQTARTFLGCDHVAKIVSISDDETILTPESISNSVLSMKEYVAVALDHKYNL